MIGRIPILDVQPAVHCGRYPAKAVADETFQVSATVFREGHEMLGAGVVLRDPRGSRQPIAAMRLLAVGTDRYGADVTPGSEGSWHFQVVAWGDPIARWRHDADIKVPLGQDVELMLAEGAVLLLRAAGRVRPARGAPPAAVHEASRARARLKAAAAVLRSAALPPADRLAAAEDPGVTAILDAFPLREMLTRSAWYPLVVHRARALYGSWYEMFPRSEGAIVDPTGLRPPQSGTLRSAARRLDAVAEMGFDVVYLPPVHPIGCTARKGANNTLTPAPGDPGSPWAIGGPAGGHDAIHPDLGTLEDFDFFVKRAAELGLEVALDLALQASPDHPWVKEHPEWLTTRVDGSIAYAENPPKKYQDIYPMNFDNDPEGIYAEVLRIIRHWMDHGVRIFRVDNPHTKPVRFWERLLAEVARTDPDVLFLAEAFTRPAMMHALAAVGGFHQSYTYFTWRNTADELREYMLQLREAAAYMRPNFFVNTPDILSPYLRHAGPAAFCVRAVLAAMLSPSWGVYSGFELCENLPAAPTSEEYLDSEKYAFRPRDWERAARAGLTLAPYITTLNSIRRAHPALQQLRNVTFHYPDQPGILCFSKRTGPTPAGRPGPAAEEPALPGAPGGDTVLVVVSLEPDQVREATVWVDAEALGLEPGSEFTVTDDLSGASYRWGQANYVRLDPQFAVAHVFTVTT
ncbi:MAG: alpha-1,4-glucan--maltose-1-phosphate maltosyltransferase [Streptosporangiaceae bacterium]